MFSPSPCCHWTMLCQLLEPAPSTGRACVSLGNLNMVVSILWVFSGFPLAALSALLFFDQPLLSAHISSNKVHLPRGLSSFWFFQELWSHGWISCSLIFVGYLSLLDILGAGSHCDFFSLVAPSLLPNATLAYS